MVKTWGLFIVAGAVYVYAGMQTGGDQRTALGGVLWIIGLLFLVYRANGNGLSPAAVRGLPKPIVICALKWALRKASGALLKLLSLLSDPFLRSRGVPQRADKIPVSKLVRDEQARLANGDTQSQEEEPSMVATLPPRP
jgi:hypothetical protein